MIAVAAMASCSKDYEALGYEDADVIVNQGISPVTVGSIGLSPGEKTIVPHQPQYVIVCPNDCKVNINGAIIYQSGVFDNHYTRKHKFD